MFRMYFCFACRATVIAAISCGWIAAPRAEAQTQIILDEQFNGNAVDTGVFTFSGSGDESFFGRTQLNSPQLPGAFDAPTVANGVLQLEINSFNPFAPGSFFLADEIRTIQQFAPTSLSGFSFETRARFVDDATNPLSPGLIGGAFLFGVDPVAVPLERDEVDFELLSNFPQDTVLTNIFNDDGFTSAGNGEFVNVPGLDLTEFNDFRIETTLSSTQFFVNDSLVRSDTTDLAVEPQDFRLNINAQGPEFAAAFSSLLQPTADPSQNQTFIFEVDSLVISELAIPPPPIVGSDPSLFDTVINVPTDPDIAAFTDIGDEDGLTTTQLNVSEGGSVGILVDVFSGSEVNINGGTVDSSFTANPGSVVNIGSGTIGIGFDALDGSVVNISGGSVDIGFTAFDGSVVNVSGGSVGNIFDALSGSEINISGGNIGNFVDGFSGSEFNLFGSDFFLNDLSLDDILTFNEAFTILDRGEDLVLTGLLADGSPFSFDLNATDVLGDDFFDPDATLTVTLVSAVPEPSSLVLFGLSGLVLLGRRRKTCR